MVLNRWGHSTPTHARDVVGGYAALVVVTLPDMDTAKKTRRSTIGSAKNATMNCKQNMPQDGKQSSEQKKELVEWRIPMTLARRR